MKTLITYVSKYGTAEKCAKLISKELDGTVDVRDLKKEKNINLDNYDTVIFASGVYIGTLQKCIVSFAQANKIALMSKKLGFLVCCKDGGDIMDGYLKKNLPEWLYEKLDFKGHMGYEMNLEKMNVFERMLLKNVFKLKESFSELNHEGINEIIYKLKEADTVKG